MDFVAAEVAGLLRTFDDLVATRLLVCLPLRLPLTGCTILLSDSQLRPRLAPERPARSDSWFRTDVNQHRGRG